ncbi:MAG: heme oxygenase (biliverdin-producing) [Gulosibacter sp.]|uniref:biliverdin-producing heme oxygenase n=1 Tax=Gulosibacter sp. TaxID=2817531 RepID=UPI003F911AD9
MTQTTTTPATLSERLRKLTATSHENAENSPFLTELLGGKLDVNAWYHLLEQYRYIYSALEETAGKMRDNDPCLELLSVELNRFESIERDLEALAKRVTVDPVGMLASTRAYVERILDTANDAPRYLAHHYVRYLGDLSGGQVMHVWLSRHYDLTDEETAFFRFEEIEKPVPFKRNYRIGLDNLSLSDAEAGRLIDEAIVSFEANEQIFAELNEIHGTARVAV